MTAADLPPNGKKAERYLKLTHLKTQPKIDLEREQIMDNAIKGFRFKKK
jgi:hypothetical protein